jgi:hypothetical protein
MTHALIGTDDGMMCVMEFLDPISLAKAALTSKIWRSPAVWDSLWLSHCRGLARKRFTQLQEQTK